MLSTEQIVRAWKDPAYRDSLTAEEREQLPPHPAGAGELTDEQLEQVAGGTLTDILAPKGSFGDSFTDLSGGDGAPNIGGSGSGPLA